MKTWLLVVWLVLPVLLSVPASAAVTAQLDRTLVAPGDSVQLVLTHDGRANSEPDLSPLQRDFDVLGTSRSSNVQIVNGHMTAQTQVQLTLSPRHAGRITIPPIVWDGEQSQPLNLQVSAAANGGPGQSGGPPSGSATRTANQLVSIQTQIGTKQPWVQAAVAVTVRVYSAQPLYQASLTLAPIAAALVQQVGPDQSSTVQRDGQQYQVLERHYLIFAQHSGKVTIPGPVLDAQVMSSSSPNIQSNDPFANFFGQLSLGNLLRTAKPIRVHGDPIVLNVRARPANASGPYWLPATDVNLTRQWQPPQLKVHAGDPISMDLSLQATGLTAAQLPDLSAMLNLPPDLKVYPDQAKLTNTSQGTTIIGKREQHVALIADAPGTFIVPALKLNWWDTKTNAQQTVTLPAQSLMVLPAGTPSTTTIAPAPSAPMSGAAHSSGSANAPDSVPPTAPSVRSPTGLLHMSGVVSWRTLSVILGLLWLITLAAWVWTRRTRARSSGRALRAEPAPAAAGRAPDPRRARRMFRDACRDNNPQAARRCLLVWAASVWRDSPPTGLRALSDRLDDTRVTALLLALDRACYAGGNWTGKPLLDALSDLTMTARPVTVTHRMTSLYPDATPRV